MNSSGSTTPDAELVAAAASGSVDAFSELFNRYHSMIYAFAYRLSLCPAEAADIAQDTFIQAARAMGGFRREASVKNWLYAIATNKSRDRRRQRDRRARLSEAWLALQGQDGGAESVSPDAGEAVRTALASLAPGQREAVALIYYEGLNHAEAARILGCAETTVSWRIFRAKQKLKRMLRPAAKGGFHE